MSETVELAEKLKSEGERMVAFFSTLTDDQLQAEVYTEGTTWTIRNGTPRRGWPSSPAC